MKHIKIYFLSVEQCILHIWQKSPTCKVGKTQVWFWRGQNSGCMHGRMEKLPIEVGAPPKNQLLGTFFPDTLCLGLWLLYWSLPMYFWTFHFFGTLTDQILFSWTIYSSYRAKFSYFSHFLGHPVFILF